MKKNISHIAEELMVDYLENNLSNQDKKKFEEILSSNEYLKKRVDSLREIINEQPLESVPVDVHNDILEKLNIKTDEDSARKRKNHFLDKMIDYLTARPILLASSISCLVIFFMTLSFNNSRSNTNDVNQMNQTVVADEEIDIKSQQDLVNEETKMTE